MTKCVRSGPIERDPTASFHAQNQLDAFLREVGIEIIGDSFEYLKSIGAPQEVYGPALKKLRNQGRFQTFCEAEKLLTYSLRKVRQSDFIISRPAPEASGGTVSETVVAWLEGIPKLVIIGPHGEGLLDNDSTFMIRMMTDRFSLVFNTEYEVRQFIEKNIEIFKSNREAIRQLIVRIKKASPHFNDRSKPLWDEKFEGKTLLLYGLPGCGKDTQARLLQDFCGFKFFGSGDELRQLYGKLPGQKSSLGEGNLAIEIIIDHLMADKLLKLEKFEPVVFAGAPKKLGEAQRLMPLLKLLGRKPIEIVIRISEVLSRRRIVLRRSCDACGISYCDEEQVENPICPKCHGSLSARKENLSYQAISNIFDWYKTDVRETIRFFEENENSALYQIDGDERSIDEIHSIILDILRK